MISPIKIIYLDFAFIHYFILPIQFTQLFLSFERVGRLHYQ